MPEKYKNRYRIASSRAAWWSYGWPGAYFITICTKNRYHFFGKITYGKMNLSPIGELANNFWYQIPDHAHDVELGVFQVMPNHIHGILILNGNVSDSNSQTKPENKISKFQNVTVDDPVETRHALSLPGLKRNPVNSVTVFRKKPQPPSPSCLRFRNQGKNTVSSIIGGYKSVVTRNAHLLNPSFDWQYRFHDHIIRNDQEYQRINDYIENNPQKWYEDQFVNRTKKR